MGHAVELYLKGALLAAGGGLNEAVSLGHNIKALLDACRAEDSAFPVQIELREEVLRALKKTGGVRIHEQLGRDDHVHFSKYSNLYYAAFSQADMKYWGTRVRREVTMIEFAFPLGGVRLCYELCDPIREYLRLPENIGQMIREKKSRDLDWSAFDSFLLEYDLLKQQTARDEDTV